MSHHILFIPFLFLEIKTKEVIKQNPIEVAKSLSKKGLVDCSLTTTPTLAKI